MKKGGRKKGEKRRGEGGFREIGLKVEVYQGEKDRRGRDGGM